MYTNMQIVDRPARSAEQTVYNHLRNEILSGRLPGGSPVRQEAVASYLGVSRIPVRDALRHLAADGLVTFETNRRVVVTELRATDLLELFEMRAVLEGLAASHAISNLSESDFDQLAWLADRMDQTERASEQWLPIHDQFHELICGRSGMPRLVREITRLRKSVEPYVCVLISIHGAAELRTSRHGDLVRSLREVSTSKDGNLSHNAELVMREHVLLAAQEILESITGSHLEFGGDGQQNH